jgi:hypothetical protein
MAFAGAAARFEGCPPSRTKLHGAERVLHEGLIIMRTASGYESFHHPHHFDSLFDTTQK